MSTTLTAVRWRHPGQIDLDVTAFKLICKYYFCVFLNLSSIALGVVVLRS